VSRVCDATGHAHRSAIDRWDCIYQDFTSQSSVVGCEVMGFSKVIEVLAGLF